MPVTKTFANASFELPLTGEVNWGGAGGVGSQTNDFLAKVADFAALNTTVKQSIRTATVSPDTIASSDFAVYSNLAVAGAVTFNLYTGVAKQILVIGDGKGDAGTNNITINGSGGQLINGSASFVINRNYGAVLLICDGSNWHTYSGILAQAISTSDLPSAIPATKIGAGSVDNTEFGYLDGVTSALQTQLDNKQPLDSDLTAVAALSTSGFVVRTGSGTAATRTLGAGSGISISNNDGVATDPVFAVTSPTLTRTSSDVGANRVTTKDLDDATVNVVNTADTTKKFHFDASTVTAGQNRTYSVPDATTTLVGTNVAQVITLKDIDGGTATNTSRVTVPKETTTNLNALTRKQGTVVYDTTLNVLKYDDGSTLNTLTAGSALDSSDDILNLTITTSVAANALTIAFKTKATTDATAGDPIKISFRNATNATGTYSVATLSAALSAVVSSGSTLGHSSATAEPIYVYALNNAGTIEIAYSTTLFDTSVVQSTTAEGGAGAADTRTVLYSTTARSNVPIRLVGKIIISETTAGTWASNATSVSLVPIRDVSASMVAGDVSGTAVPSGYLGERLIETRVLSNETALTTTVAKNVTSSTNTGGSAGQIVIKKGRWMVYGVVGFDNISTSVAGVQAGFSLTSNTLPASDTFGVPNANGEIQSSWSAGSVNFGQQLTVNFVTYVEVSSDTAYYLVAKGSFSGGTSLSVYGSVMAIRR